MSAPTSCSSKGMAKRRAFFGTGSSVSSPGTPSGKGKYRYQTASLTGPQDWRKPDVTSKFAGDFQDLSGYISDGLDLSQLTDEERSQLCTVLQKVRESDKRAADHCKYLKEQQLTLESTSPLVPQGTCPLCSRSLAGIVNHICDMCSERLCHHCLSSVHQPVPRKSEQKYLCKLCFVKRQVMLTSTNWRDDDRLNAPEDVQNMPGYGMVLVCGIKTDGGVLRTFVAEAPVGGMAHLAGLMEGDEIMSWCDEGLVGEEHERVSKLVRQNCHGSTFVKVRRFTHTGGEEQLVIWVRQHLADSVSVDWLVQRMLVNPVAVGFAGGIYQAIGDGQTPFYPHGRINLRLGVEGSTLSVTVLVADRLTALKPGAPPSPSASLSINGRNTKSTTECHSTREPQWNELLTFNLPSQVEGCVLHVAVKTARQFFGKVSLGECLIRLDEQVYNDEGKWYCLQPPASSLSASSFRPPCPPHDMNKRMLSTHCRRMASVRKRSAAPTLGSFVSDPGTSSGAARSGGMPPSPNRFRPKSANVSGSLTPPPRPRRSRLSSVPAMTTSTQDCFSDSEMMMRKRKFSAPAGSPDTISPLVSQHSPTSLGRVPPSPPPSPPSRRNSTTPPSGGGDTEQLAAEEKSQSGSPPKETAPKPVRGRQRKNAPISHQTSIDDVLMSSESEATGVPVNRRQKIRKTASQRKIESAKHRRKAVVQSEDSRPVTMAVAKPRRKPADISTECPSPTASVDSSYGLDSPTQRSRASTIGACESPRQARPRFSEIFGGGAGNSLSVCSGDSDALSILSSISDMSDSGSCYSLEGTIIDGKLQDTSVELSLTPSSRHVKVTVVKIDNFNTVVDHENIKWGRISGVGIKLSLLCVGSRRQKHKTRPQLLANCVRFDQEFSFDLPLNPSHYTLKVQVVVKLKGSQLRSRRSLPVAQRLLPMQDLSLKLGSSHTEVLKVCARSAKPSVDD